MHFLRILAAWRGYRRGITIRRNQQDIIEAEALRLERNFWLYGASIDTRATPLSRYLQIDSASVRLTFIMPRNKNVTRIFAYFTPSLRL